MLRRPFLKTHYQDLKGFEKPLNSLISGLSSSEGLVDLQPFFFRFTLSTTTALIFGQSVESTKDEERDIFAKAFDHASMITSLRARLQDLYWIYTPSKYKASCKTVKDYAGAFVKRALESKESENAETDTDRYAFIQDLYNDLQDPTLVRDQIVNILLAGRDTTACLLSWTL